MSNVVKSAAQWCPSVDMNALQPELSRFIQSGPRRTSAQLLTFSVRSSLHTTHKHSRYAAVRPQLTEDDVTLGHTVGRFITNKQSLV
ncbi:hypothetical protein Q8A67_024118 [Cirrhinus molitorella]|uniref:Uncharacterized protein n=1 Tax=Cirrhinus molitorella TaxID=172907 RepID=A0AA88P3L1_9TELE|nr:hypothetical protein Q8A67_024118 [Cirrhinus molitorella]